MFRKLYWHEKEFVVPSVEISEDDKEIRTARFVSNLVAVILTGGMLIGWLLLF